MATMKDSKLRPMRDLLNPKKPQMSEDEENEFLADIANWISGEMDKTENPFTYLKTMLEFIGYVSLLSFDPRFEYSFASRKWPEGGYGVGIISS
jgi:hypothetical protein